MGLRVKREIRCPKCGKFLFATTGLDGKIEIKCQCKKITNFVFTTSECPGFEVASDVVYTGSDWWDKYVNDG